jgi:heme-degrading monooxygenase HmoA
MIVYEVDLVVATSAADAYAEWLAGHVRQMLALPGFVDAEWLEDTEASGHTRWVVRYRLESAEALERYFAESAEAMRADGQARFGGRFTASRRVLRPVQTFAREG